MHRVPFKTILEAFPVFTKICRIRSKGTDGALTFYPVQNPCGGKCLYALKCSQHAPAGFGKNRKSPLSQPTHPGKTLPKYSGKGVALGRRKIVSESQKILDKKLDTSKVVIQNV